MTRVDARTLLSASAEPSFAALLSLFRQQKPTEPRGRHAAAERLTRIHIYEPFDADSALGVTSELYQGAPQEFVSISKRSCLRRISDGGVVAFAETVLR